MHFLPIGLVDYGLTRIGLVLDILCVQKCLEDPFRVGHRIHILVHLRLSEATDAVEELAGAVPSLLGRGLLRVLASSQRASQHWRVLIEGESLLGLLVVRCGGHCCERPHRLSSSSSYAVTHHHQPHPRLLAVHLLCLSQLSVVLSDGAAHRWRGALIACSKIALSRLLLRLPHVVDLDLAEAGGLRSWISRRDLGKRRRDG